MSSKKPNPFKDFQSDQIQRSSRKIFTAHYACRNAALNLTPVTGTTNGFIFQIINSLIESWGVRLTWFDCNIYFQGYIFVLHPDKKFGKGIAQKAQSHNRLIEEPDIQFGHCLVSTHFR